MIATDLLYIAHCLDCNVKIVYNERYGDHYCPQCDKWCLGESLCKGCNVCIMKPYTPQENYELPVKKRCRS